MVRSKHNRVNLNVLWATDPRGQAGHPIQGVLQAISRAKATIGSASDHTSISRRVFTSDEGIDG